MKLKPGADPANRINVKDSRGMRFCGLGAFVGTGRLGFESVAVLDGGFNAWKDAGLPTIEHEYSGI